MAEQYNVNKSTIWRRLGKMRHIRIISTEKEVVINMDTTYWGRNFGLMVIKDTFRNKILWYKFVRHETVADYIEGIEWLRANGFKIYGIVCDGLGGLFQALRQYRVQMCQFHQIMIVRRYLTLSPELPAAVELLNITNLITQTDKDCFLGMVDEWYGKWSDFLKERSVDRKTAKSTYTHKRLRSAYHSLLRNM